MTRVSVALASYNGMKYIETFLRSVRNQDWAGLSLVVSDDASSDTTVRIISDVWPEATIVSNTGPAGAIGNFSNALSHARGGYVALADQDDVWMPEKINRLMAKMTAVEGRNPGMPVLIFSDLKVVDEELNIIQNSFFQSTNKNIDAAILRDFVIGNHIPGCAMLVNDALLQRALPIPVDVMMHDWWLALVASTFGVIEHVDAPLILYRQHGSNTLGAPTLGKSAGKWRRRMQGPSHRMQDYRRNAAAARRTLLAFRDRFAGALPSEATKILRLVLDKGPFVRLITLRGAHTGENRIKALIQGALM